jgi:hypothetical protein
MRHSFFFFLFAAPFFAGLVPLAAQSQNPAANAPLPNASDLLQRALANEHKMAAEQERYECRITSEMVETDSKGNAKKTTNEVKDQFFVNGMPIERTIQKNGKELTPGDAKKQDERVMKETLKYSNQATAKKEADKQNKELEDFIGAMMLIGGRREQVNGHSVLYYDIVPNPKFQAKNLNQRLAQVMQGKVSVDEQTGEMIEVDITTVADLKIAGGVLANLHKGMRFHIHNHLEPDGVWLNDLAEGSGDARAALFLHPYFRFKETTGSCHLYTATATQTGQAQVVRPK